MKNKDVFMRYTADIIEGTAPYVKKIGEHAGMVASSVGKSVKRRSQRVKRQMKIVRIKYAIELASNIALLAAAVIALIMAAVELLKNLKD